jgi:hypothetical protein
MVSGRTATSKEDDSGTPAEDRSSSVGYDSDGRWLWLGVSRDGEGKLQIKCARPIQEEAMRMPDLSVPRDGTEWLM